MDICNNKGLLHTDTFFADIIQINHHHNNTGTVKGAYQAHLFTSTETLPFPNSINIDATGNCLSADFASPLCSFGS